MTAVRSTESPSDSPTAGSCCPGPSSRWATRPERPSARGRDPVDPLDLPDPFDRDPGTGQRRFTTADLGVLADGVLTVLGRADDVLISGGVNVAPLAVEHALAAAPGVAQVAITGIPDPNGGSRLVAVVVPTVDVRPDLDTLRSLAAASLGPAGGAAASAPDRRAADPGTGQTRSAPSPACAADRLRPPGGPGRLPAAGPAGDIPPPTARRPDGDARRTGSSPAGLGPRQRWPRRLPGDG